MSARLVGLAVAAVLAGCAAAPAEPPHAGKPLAAYAADPFVPVNLFVNADEHLEPAPARRVEYAARRLAESGAFVRADRGVTRWPVTLQLRYALAEEPAVGRRLLCALTLGLVPVHVTQRHVLTAEVFAEPESVGTLDLAMTTRRRVSLWDLGGAEAGERAAIDTLLERLLAEVAQRKLIPRWKAFEPEPPPKRKEKKVPGRAT